MWRRTNDSNKILIHSVETAMWNVLGTTASGNWPLFNNSVGDRIEYMKMSNSGPNGLVTRTNTSSNPHTCRYEPGGAGTTSNSYPDSGSMDLHYLLEMVLIHMEVNLEKI
jgi:hypothetical protein